MLSAVVFTLMESSRKGIGLSPGVTESARGLWPGNTQMTVEIYTPGRIMFQSPAAGRLLSLPPVGKREA